MGIGAGEVISSIVMPGLEPGIQVVSVNEAELVEGVRRSTDAAWGKFSQYHHSPEPIDVAYPPAFKAWVEA